MLCHYTTLPYPKEDDDDDDEDEDDDEDDDDDGDDDDEDDADVYIRNKLIKPLISSISKARLLYVLMLYVRKITPPPGRSDHIYE